MDLGLLWFIAYTLEAKELGHYEFSQSGFS